MKNSITSLTPNALTALKTELEREYQDYVRRDLKLDMSRGKPAPKQLDLCNGMLSMDLKYRTENGTDARNYGVMDGLPECKAFFAELLDLDPKQIVIGGNSSLAMMYDQVSRLMLFGTGVEPAWKTCQDAGRKIKFLCPVPGYDRHFKICEAMNIEMIPVPLHEDGPDMELISGLVRADEMIKGIWCVPLYSNPQGVCYSDQVVGQLANLETAAKDFRIFWDNAYAIHPIYQAVPLASIFKAVNRSGGENRIYYFFSTSKISFPGAGVAMMASGAKSIAEIKKHMSAQTISYDKLNQLRHLQYFQSADGMKGHMRELADLLRPKFDMVLSKLQDQLGGTGLAKWSTPRGGYFISLDTYPGCAKEVVSLAGQAGVKLTEAGATYPYGLDENDSNIRIAPSYPELEELDTAMDLLCICVKLAGVDKLLRIQEG
ncbi:MULTISPECIES: aminotransferase class I/II-fold pyridoxal phosphate-dependent enzyme [Acutalibacteraceae]|uniref:aminotransferase class I/II-fold pyridoxal phosphate-dependent enzyme n=1 Tax=Acutalibacteraceae TaxID=3082771 RepID=UPI001FAB27DE|nr:MULTISPECIES: aminotransferase class I/II-fold pyridoxal phosphate-dependent enzyme [Acutalibacteraceae]